jgi:predicted O-methyltransferase YrrM
MATDLSATSWLHIGDGRAALAWSAVGDLREKLVRRRRQARALALEAADLRALPPRVAAFYARAWWTAVRSGDGYSLVVVTRPSDVATLLALADGHRSVVELGTATAWTTAALALADDGRHVAGYDPAVRPERERYLGLLRPRDRSRIALHRAAAQDVRPEPGSVGFVFVDCAHDRQTTADAFRAWEPAVVWGGVIAFHDFDHPDYPGVREAVEELGLTGEVRGGVFVWRKPA